MAASFLSRLRAIDIPALLFVAVPALLVAGRGLSEITMGVVSVLFLLHSVRQKDFSCIRQPWVRLALVVWAYLILCGLLADFDVAGGVARALTWLRFPLFTAAGAYWVLPRLKNTIVSHPLMAPLFLALVCLDGLVQFFTGASLTGYAFPLPHRLGGPFGDDPVIGVYLARLGWPALGLVFGWALGASVRTARFYAPLLFLALFTLTILLSGERMALLLFALAGFCFFLGARDWRKILAMVGTCGLVIVIVLVAALPSIRTRIIDQTRYTLTHFSDSSYGHILHNSFIALKISPVMGLGPKNYPAACEALGESGGFKIASPAKTTFDCARHPHNIYLEWLVETGVIGLVLFLSLIVLWLRESYASWRQTPELYYPKLGALVGLVPFLWPLASGMSFFSNWSAILFWWVLACALARPAKNSAT
jgi:O-antigen ligase